MTDSSTFPPFIALPCGRLLHVSQGGLVWFTPATLNLLTLQEMVDRLAILFPHHPSYHGLVDMPCTARYLVNEVLCTRANVKEGTKTKSKSSLLIARNASAKNIEEILWKY